MDYSEKVLDHFTNPRNVGEIPDADGVGTVGNPKCGDIMKMFLKIEDGVIVDCKFKTFGCGAAIATSSMATELIKGKTIEEALKLTNKAVVEAIRSHTTGKANMNMLEKIIYVADYMEPNRDFPGVERLRELAFSDMDAALKLGL